MLLSTPSFVLFLLAVAALHRLLPPKFRRGFLLLASAVYYCSFHPAYLLLLAALVLLCHRLGIVMERAESDKKRSALCTAGAAAILLHLPYFYCGQLLAFRKICYNRPRLGFEVNENGQ